MKKAVFIIYVITVLALTNSVFANGIETYPNDWEKIKLKGLNLQRLQVPGGWLVREGLGKMLGLALDGQERKIVFVPDVKFEWKQVDYKSWETLKLKGLNLYRLKLPEGWLVREGYGKVGSENQSLGFLYLDDKSHSWNIHF